MEDYDIDSVYNQLMEDGVNILDLYIYNCIMENESSWYMNKEERKEALEKIKSKYLQDYQGNNLDYYIETILADGGDEDEWD